jgi:hypothetical protein
MLVWEGKNVMMVARAHFSRAGLCEPFRPAASLSENMWFPAIFWPGAPHPPV